MSDPAGRRRTGGEGRRRPPRRVGDLLPGVATSLGLENEFRLARAIATWERLVAERIPAAAGASRLLQVGKDFVVVGADEPIVAQELHLHESELLEAFRAAPGGTGARELRVVVRRRPSRG